MKRLLACAGILVVAGCVQPAEIIGQTMDHVQVDGGLYNQAYDLAQASCQRNGRTARFRDATQVGTATRPLTSRT